MRFIRVLSMMSVVIPTAFLWGPGAVWASSDAGENPVLELRIYHCNPGKLEALHQRFRAHTTKLFEKHGMTNVGYFVPVDEEKGKADTLVYILAHKSRESAKASWAAFGDDPEWKRAKNDSEVDGTPLVKLAESKYLDMADYSPSLAKSPQGGGTRAFELRVYTASPGKLADLHARFRDHTTGLFAKHGMTNLLYGVPQDADKGKDDTLVYLLAFPTREAASKSWKAFSDDPEWQKVYKESQPDGVPLAAKVESIYLSPTDYSPLK